MNTTQEIILKIRTRLRNKEKCSQKSNTNYKQEEKNKVISELNKILKYINENGLYDVDKQVIIPDDTIKAKLMLSEDICEHLNYYNISQYLIQTLINI